MKSFFFFFFLFYSLSLNVFSADYYWVGGIGNWSDINHWATSSGGSVNYLQVPTPFDDVFFDVNSFTGSNQTVTIDVVNSVCRDMNWTGAAFTPSITGSFDFRIYGSLTLVPGMDWNFSGQIFFEATTTGKTITSAGKSFSNNVYFQGIGGGWTLMDDLSTSQTLYFINGSLNTNGKTVGCNTFLSEYSNPRNLILGSSSINIIDGYSSTINSDNLSIDPGTSCFNFVFFQPAYYLNIIGSNSVAFYNIEITRSNMCLCPSPNLDIPGININPPTLIHKLTLSGGINGVGGYSSHVKIDSLIVNDCCSKSIENTVNVSITTILCNTTTYFIVYADQYDTIQNIFFNGTSGTIYGNNAKFHKVLFWGNGSLNGNNTYDTLLFAPGKSYYLASESTQTINDYFTATGNCSMPIMMFASGTGVAATLLKTMSSVTIDYVTLRDIHAIGGATFIANNSIDMGNNTGWSINGPSPLNLYWVGGTGNWSDITHWSLSSGGPGGACLPSPIDNVFFDVNSFSVTGQSVTINSGDVNCYNMDWTGASYTPSFICTNGCKLYVYGNLKFITDMTLNFSGQILFEATTAGKTITSAGKSFSNNVYFQGIGGGWTLMDDLSTSQTLYFINGSLNTNGKTVGCITFLSEYSNPRNLILGSSSINIIDGYSSTINSDNLSIDPGTSCFNFVFFQPAYYLNIIGSNSVAFYNIEITRSNMCLCPSPNLDIPGININPPTLIHKLTLSGGINGVGGYSSHVKIDSLIVNDCCSKSIENTVNVSITTILCNATTYFIVYADQYDTIQNIFFNGTSGTIYGNNAKFHKVLFGGNGSLNGNNTYDTLLFSPGKSYYLASESTQTINDYFTATGNCSMPIMMFASGTGVAATLLKTMSSVTIDYVTLRDIHAIGGATFIANNSIDMGNNTGWSINGPSPLNLYWVGGTGNWSDITHWSLSSGGPGGACLPSPIDNVFFDVNSFSVTGQSVTINSGDVNCKNMDWTGASYTPSFICTNGCKLYVYGNLKFITDMILNFSGQIFFEATTTGKTITSGGKSFSNNVHFQGIGGGWTLMDDFSTSETLYFINGALNTNSKTVSCKRFLTEYSNPRTLILGASSINIIDGYSSTINSDNLSIDPGTSCFNFVFSQNAYYLNIIGSNSIAFYKIEITRSSMCLCPSPNLDIPGININPPTLIHKLTLSGGINQIRGYSSHVKIDSLIVNDCCSKSIENTVNVSITTILCNATTNFIVYADQNDTIQNIFFNGTSGTIYGNNAKFHKVIILGDGSLNGYNTFDSLSFSSGHFYHLESGTTQTITDDFRMRGNGCFPITLQSTIDGVQSIISKADGIVSGDYIEMRDQKAEGGAQFYAGNFSTNVSNNNGWTFSNAPGYSFGLGPDTTFCQGDTLVLTTTGFNGGNSWLWNNGSVDSILKITQSGLYWVKVTYENYCFLIDSIQVTMKPRPVAVASSNSPVCIGDTVKLFGSGGSSYFWNGPNGFISNLQNPFILNSTLADTGRYYLMVTSNGCPSLIDTTYVIISAGFPASINISASPSTTICAGDTVAFTATPTNGGSSPSYQWKVNGLNVGINSTTYSYTPINDDVVTCTLTSNSTCVTGNPAPSNAVTMTVNPNLPVNISIIASANPVCAGDTVCFTATPINADTNTVITWMVNKNINDGLIAYYPFNGNANDESGNGNNGVVHGASLSTDRFGNPNKAYSFNGTSNYIEVLDKPILRFNNSFSISLWVSVTSLSHILYNYTLIDKPLGPLCSDSYTIYWGSDNKSNAGYCNLSDCRNNKSTSSLNLNTWYNITWVFDKTLNAEILYINGSLISSQPISIPIEYDNHTLTMGKGICYEADQEFLDGKLDDIRLYNRTLTTTEILQLYHDGDSTFCYVPSNGDSVYCILTSSYPCAINNPDTSNVIVMTVDPLLPVSASITAVSNTVCQGDTVTFTASVVNGGSNPTYWWYVNGNLVSSPLTCNTISNGLVGCYPFNGNANDESLNGNDGVNYGAFLTTDRFNRPDNAFDFDGFSSYIEVPDSPSINPTSAITISLWIKTDEPYSLRKIIPVSKRILSGDIDYQIYLNHNSDNLNTPNIAFFHSVGNDYSVYRSEPVDWYDGQWHFISFTYESGIASSARLYMDCTFLPGSWVEGTGSEPLADRDSPMTIGRQNIIIPPLGYVNGKIDDIRIYNRTLSQSEIYQIVTGNDSTYTYVPSDGDSVYCIITSSDSCTINNPDTSNVIIITVNPLMPVSVSISASANPVCAGASVTFTAIPINGGIIPAYQWKVNGTDVGTDNPVYSYAPADGDRVTCVLTSNATCATGSPAESNMITMTVKPLLPVSVSIAASANSVCAGTPVTFTAIPTNGGTTPSYEWKVNGVAAGTNSSVYSYTPANNDQVYCILTSNVTCPAGNPATSNIVVMVAITAPDVSLNICTTITTRGAKPFVLKGGIPLGGIYSGTGVIGNTFYPALIPIGQTIVPITYSYSNSYGCPGSAIQNITVLQEPPFTCGQQLIDVRDNSIYPSILIGTQCWMAKSLNFGNSISAYMTQNDNCTAEKYCYNDNVLKCDSLGGLYQWDELMQYSETPVIQGLCPPGWHVPDENEWTLLFNHFGGNGFAGDTLRYNGTSGFNALLAGAYFGNRQFEFKNFSEFFWSSTSHSNHKAWAHAINSINHGVSYYPSLRNNAFSVRCIKD